MDSVEVSSTFINKIPQINATRHFIFKSNWWCDEINLEILDSYESKEWECIISHSELKDSANELEIPYDEFFDECKKALTTNGGSKYFQYSIEDNKFTLTKEDEFKMQYLQVSVTPTYGLQQLINISAVDLMETLKNELLAEKEKSNKLNEENQDTIQKLGQCIQEINSLERSLLKRFAVLINSEKDKVAELQDLLVEKNKKLDEVVSSGVEPVKRRSSEAFVNSVESDDEFLEPTQVMTLPAVSLPKRKKFASNEELVSRRCSSGTKEDMGVASSPNLPSQNMTLGESPDLFDLM